jgi:hypothetical protein
MTVPPFPTQPEPTLITKTGTSSGTSTPTKPKRCYPIESHTQSAAYDPETGLDVEGERPEPASTLPAPTTTNSYASNTELADGQHALLIDPGSVNNLTGGEWVRRGATLARAAGRSGSSSHQRKETLHVSGVGTQSQECHYNIQLPVALQDINGKAIEGTYTAPTINNSRLPALLGLNTLMQCGAIMDFRNMHLHFTGQGPVDYMQHLPEGTTTFNMLQAPSGHVMLPCCKYPSQQTQPQEDGSLTLHHATYSGNQQSLECLPTPLRQTGIDPRRIFSFLQMGTTSRPGTRSNTN